MVSSENRINREYLQVFNGSKFNAIVLGKF